MCVTQIQHCKSRSFRRNRHTIIRALTGEVVCGPGAENTGPASVLIRHKLILLAGSASPAAAHLSFTDHLETHMQSKVSKLQWHFPVANLTLYRPVDQRNERRFARGSKDCKKKKRKERKCIEYILGLHYFIKH